MTGFSPRNFAVKRPATTTFATFDPANKGTDITLSNGNLTATDSALGDITTEWVNSTIGKSSGKWYWEITAITIGDLIVGIKSGTSQYYPGFSNDSYGYYSLDGKSYKNNVGAAYGATYIAGDVIGVALDMDGGTIKFYKNNSLQGTAYSAISGTNYAAVGSAGSGVLFSATANFGATALTYTPPSGYNAGLYS